MATGESQWAPPEVFQPQMICEWEGCGRRFDTANQLQDHQWVDHYWTCFACREDNDITTYPMCPKCGNSLDEQGRTMMQMHKDKVRECVSSPEVAPRWLQCLVSFVCPTPLSHTLVVMGVVVVDVMRVGGRFLVYLVGASAHCHTHRDPLVQAREEELVRLARKRRDMLTAHRARQAASVPSSDQVERLKSAAQVRRSKVRGEGLARGLDRRDGEGALGTRPGSSFRELVAKQKTLPPARRRLKSAASAKRLRSRKGRKKKQHRRGGEIGAPGAAAAAPAAAAATAGGVAPLPLPPPPTTAPSRLLPTPSVGPEAGGDVRAGAGGAGAGGAGAGGAGGRGRGGGGGGGDGTMLRAPSPPKPARSNAGTEVVPGALLNWGGDERLFAAAQSDVDGHRPASVLPLPPAPALAASSMDAGADVGAAGGDTRPTATPVARGTPVAAARLLSPARSVRFVSPRDALGVGGANGSPRVLYPGGGGDGDGDGDGGVLDAGPASASSSASALGTEDADRLTRGLAEGEGGGEGTAMVPLSSAVGTADVQAMENLPTVKRLETALVLQTKVGALGCCVMETCGHVCLCVCKRCGLMLFMKLELIFLCGSGVSILALDQRRVGRTPQAVAGSL